MPNRQWLLPVSSSSGSGSGSSTWPSLTGDLTKTQIIPWDGNTVGTPDTGISRTAAKTLAVGNGTAGNATGTIEAATFADSGSDYITMSALTGSVTINANTTFTLQDGQGDFVSLTASTGLLSLSVVNVLLASQTVFQWGSSSGDTGLSRLAAASLALGNGTANDTSGALTLKKIFLSDFGSAPTSAGAAGTAGEVVYHGGLLYFCSVTGAAGSATWNKLNMTAV